jgi:hypothetical protein
MLRRELGNLSLLNPLQYQAYNILSFLNAILPPGCVEEGHRREEAAGGIYG